MLKCLAVAAPFSLLLASCALEEPESDAMQVLAEEYNLLVRTNRGDCTAYISSEFENWRLNRVALWWEVRVTEQPREMLFVFGNYRPYLECPGRPAVHNASRAKRGKTEFLLWAP